MERSAGPEPAEAALVRLWRSGRLVGRRLAAADGTPLTVLYPGLRSGGLGPDFSGAAIAWGEGGVQRGDIEVHSDSRLWRCHGHHLDPRYNGVVLHVVWRHAAGTRAALQGGGAAPVLALEAPQSWMETPRLPWPPCRQKARRRGAVTALLDRLGAERFAARAAAFELELGRASPGQAFYARLMEALGYAGNRAAFLELAALAPLAELEDMPGVGARQALLLGRAGLLPGQRPTPADDDPWVLGLAGAWSKARPGPGLPWHRWELGGARPANHPARRLAAMAELSGRWSAGLWQGVLGLVRLAGSGGRPRLLGEGLRVGAGGYWARRWDFGVPLSKEMALLGIGRCRSVAVDVVLPFCFAWGRLFSDRGLCRAALRLYREHPALPFNRITRHVLEQLIGPGLNLRLSACRQQGLMRLYRSYCSGEGCLRCPAARPGAGWR